MYALAFSLLSAVATARRSLHTSEVMIGRELMSASPSPGMYGGYYGDFVVDEPEEVDVAEPVMEPEMEGDDEDVL